MEERRKGLWNRSVMTMLYNKRLIIRAIFSVALIGFLFYLVYLLFYKKPEDSMKDMINVTLGAILMAFGKITDFWFRRDDEDKKEDKIDPTD